MLFGVKCHIFYGLQNVSHCENIFQFYAAIISYVIMLIQFQISMGTKEPDFNTRIYLQSIHSGI